MYMRMLTYNVFFDEFERSSRMKEIGKIISKHRPAVIALQEVTSDALTMLRSQVKKIVIKGS